ncbi:MAG: lipoyl(octanoyl) transferase LipB [Neisseriaceae bacterium]|nr:lipoyl(octanoyl) transferase LipB [Neisseriaceae bacterium]
MKIRYFRNQPYLPMFEAMKIFTDERTAQTEDEFWVVEHQAVFTQGKAGKPEHILNAGNIPVVQTDRGGQVTYHGTGQVTVYTLVDFARLHISVHELVTRLEKAIIAVLAEYDIDAYAEEKRPGVYVAGKKIASLGLRIRHKAVYHGLSLNVNMDLSPFQQINPCGYAGLEMTQIADFVQPCPSWEEVSQKLVFYLAQWFDA